MNAAAAPALERVAELVAGETGIAAAEIFEPGRGPVERVRARQLAMYLAAVALGQPIKRIGRAVGREPGTVRHALARVEDLRDDPAIDAAIDKMERQLSGPAIG